MSRATELAEAEAAAAEAEDTTTNDDDDTTTTPVDDEAEEQALDDDQAQGEPEPQPIDQRELDKRMRAMDRETERHALAVARVMGDDFDTVTDCPLCDFPGFTFLPGTREIDPLQRQAVLIALGDEPTPDLAQHPDYKRCDDCHGLGMVKTGAENPANWQLPCPKCDGRGYRGTVDAPAQAPVIQFPPVTLPPPAMPPAAVPLGVTSGYLNPATGEFVPTPPGN